MISIVWNNPRKKKGHGNWTTMLNNVIINNYDVMVMIMIIIVTMMMMIIVIMIMMMRGRAHHLRDVPVSFRVVTTALITLYFLS